jgi:hypothetical protein
MKLSHSLILLLLLTTVSEIFSIDSNEPLETSSKTAHELPATKPDEIKPIYSHRLFQISRNIGRPFPEKSVFSYMKDWFLKAREK